MNLRMIKYRDAVEIIYRWKYRHISVECFSFSYQLVTLIHRADHENREHLRYSFPVIVAAYEAWNEKGDQLFIDMGIM